MVYSPLAPEKKTILHSTHFHPAANHKLTKYLICSAVPLLVAFVIAHAASFLVLKSAVWSMVIKTENILASITAWICCRLPAAIFDIVQQASFRTVAFPEFSNCSMQGNALQFKMTCVCISSPVTMLPTARKAAVTTLVSGCLFGNKLVFL